MASKKSPLSKPNKQYCKINKANADGSTKVTIRKEFAEWAGMQNGDTLIQDSQEIDGIRYVRFYRSMELGSQE